MPTAYRILFAGILLGAALAAQANPVPVSLRNVPIPPVPGLLDGPNPIVVDKDKAIALGKALFWDQNLGSDGQACASCHFSAGADGRVKNQINPGQESALPSGQVFSALGPNHTLTAGNFPLSVSSDDVVGSAGTFGGEFAGASKFSGADDQCTRTPDEVFNVGQIGVRRVTTRNTPTVINAVFNHRNFWDGRASNVFNGSSPWGARDPDAGVWVKLDAKTVVKQRLELVNSSLASQAVAPPVFSDSEMGCQTRGWPDIGRKLLLRQPLQYQQVHPQDSVLGGLSQSSGAVLKPGLKTTYKTLVTQAFDSQYWSYAKVGSFGAPAAGGTPYNQMEANFAMFFGLAIQLYESTLVSDQSPFDLSPLDANMLPTWTNVDNADLRASLRRGVDLFVSGQCSVCHTGPNFSLAAVVTNAELLTPTEDASFGPPDTPIAYGPNAFGPANAAGTFTAARRYPGPVTREVVANGQGGLGNVLGLPSLKDTGFINIGVTRSESDPGLGGLDPFGNPLSYADQYVEYLAGNASGIVDLNVEEVRACDFVTPLALNIQTSVTSYFRPGDGIQPDGSREGSLRNENCTIPQMAYIPTVAAARANYDNVKMSLATLGTFKVPTLRNIALTGPYMHNGSMSTLAQVLAFYDRDGNFSSPSFSNSLMEQAGVGFGTQNINDTANFLNALTDERVRYERAPFDHPQLTVIHGHAGDAAEVEAGNPLGAVLAKDELLVIPAVGANGSAKPISPFPMQVP